jgi:hypothetical protein
MAKLYLHPDRGSDCPVDLCIIMKKKLDEAVDELNRSMSMCEAQLSQTYDEDTITLAKAGIAAMIQTIGMNVLTHKPKGKMGSEFAKVMIVALTLCRTLDTASDHVADVPNQKN